MAFVLVIEQDLSVQLSVITRLNQFAGTACTRLKRK